MNVHQSVGRSVFVSVTDFHRALATEQALETIVGVATQKPAMSWPLVAAAIAVMVAINAASVTDASARCRES